MSDCARRHPELAADHELVLLEQATTLNAEGFRLAPATGSPPPTDRRRPRAEPSEPRSAACTPRGRSRAGCGSTGSSRRTTPTSSRPRSTRASTAPCAPPGTAIPASKASPSRRCGPAALVDLAAQAMRHEPSDASVPDRYRVAVIVRAGRAGDARGSGLRRRRLPGGARPPRARSSMSAGRRHAGRSASAGPSPCVTGAASSPAATGPRHGPTSTTAHHGRKAAPRQWTMARYCAAAITPSCTSSDGDHDRQRPTHHPKTRRHVSHDRALAPRRPRLVNQIDPNVEENRQRRGWTIRSRPRDDRMARFPPPITRS